MTVKEECNDLTTKLLPISQKFSMGIRRKVQKVETIRPTIQSLCESWESQSVDIGDRCLQIGKLKMVPKTFILQNSAVEIIMNKALKNYFQKESYKCWKVLDAFKMDIKVGEKQGVPIKYFINICGKE